MHDIYWTDTILLVSTLYQTFRPCLLELTCAEVGNGVFGQYIRITAHV
jgi:hypothetical protein